MRKTKQVLALAFIGLISFGNRALSQMSGDKGPLKVVIIRHAEKPKTGDNLTCQGVTRSLQLPAVLIAKFGVPTYTYIPSLGLGESTKHSRMFQTVTPLASKYNLILDSKYDEFDSAGVTKDILHKTGVVLMVWQHHAIPSVVRSLGVKIEGLKWDDGDFDSIWVITFPKGVPTLTKDAEALSPSPACSY